MHLQDYLRYVISLLQKPTYVVHFITFRKIYIRSLTSKLLFDGKRTNRIGHTKKGACAIPAWKNELILCQLALSSIKRELYLHGKLTEANKSILVFYFNENA